VKSLSQKPVIILACIVLLFVLDGVSSASEGHQLYVGWAAADITPDRPVALLGQMHKRISQGVNDPLTVTALALETKGANGRKEQAIMVSCDLLWTRKAIQERLQGLISTKLDDFDASKLFLNATHTHTAPGFIDGTFLGLYDVSKNEGVMKASEYADFFVERVAETVVKAWKSRKPAGVSWALGHAVVGYNRRVAYFDGHAQMLSAVNREDFSHIEGYEDHGVPMLFFWDQNKKPTGVLINVACPAQVVGGAGYISADFWHDVREKLWEKFGKDLFVFPQCGAAGDQCPLLIIRKRAEQEMLKRKGLSARQEFANRIVKAVNDEFAFAKKDIKNKVVFKHAVVKLDVPVKEPPATPFYKTDSVKPAEFHIIRLGDVAIATSPFELFLDYGLCIQTHSRTVLTFVVQLSCQHSGYLPTVRAVGGGGYSAVKYIVGPEGGQVLVDEAVKRINAMWK